MKTVSILQSRIDTLDTLTLGEYLDLNRTMEAAAKSGEPFYTARQTAAKLGIDDAAFDSSSPDVARMVGMLAKVPDRLTAIETNTPPATVTISGREIRVPKPHRIPWAAVIYLEQKVQEMQGQPIYELFPYILGAILCRPFDPDDADVIAIESKKIAIRYALPIARFFLSKLSGILTRNPASSGRFGKLLSGLVTLAGLRLGLPLLRSVSSRSSSASRATTLRKLKR